MDQLEKELAKNLAWEMYVKRFGEMPGLSTQILLEPLAREIAAGEYPLARVYHGNRPTDSIFGLREQDWIRHVAIFGISGSGKSNTAFVLLASLLKHKKPFLIFDWKRNYRDFADWTKSKREILIFTVGNDDVSPFYFNPLIPPPGTKPGIWMNKLIEVIGHAFFVGSGVFKWLRQAIASVYRQYGIYEGSTDAWPTLMDVLNELEEYKVRGRKQDWMDSAERAIEALCHGDIANCLNVMRPIEVGELLQRNIILELDALSEEEKVFFTEALLLWIHHYRMAQPDRETFKHAIIIEEAHHILMKKKQELVGGEAVTDIILREIRELGEGIVIIDQHPSLISIPALGDTNCTIGMALKHKSDVDALGAAMLLEGKERLYLGQLPIGYGIVRVQGRSPKNFLVKFPHVKVKKGSVSNGMVKEKMKDFWGDVLKVTDSDFKKTNDNSGTYAGVLKNSTGPRGIEESKEIGGQRAKPDFPAASGPVLAGEGVSKDKGEEADTGLTPEAEKLFMDISEHPLDRLKARYKRLGFTRWAGDQAKDLLISEGLAQAKESIDSRGNFTLLEPTEPSWEVFQGEHNGSKRHGGLEHAYGIHRAAEHFRRKGFQVSDGEWPLGGGMYADRAVFISGQAEGTIECETMKAGNADVQMLQNIRKALEAGFKWVCIVTMNGKGFRRAHTALEEFQFFGGKVQIKLVWEMF